MKLAAQGAVYRGSKTVMWSVGEKPPLAAAEVEYEDFTSDTVWVKFPVDFLQSHNVSQLRNYIPSISQFGIGDPSVIIWTTTPWTLPGNRAISFSTKIQYELSTITAVLPGSLAKVG